MKGGRWEGRAGGGERERRDVLRSDSPCSQVAIESSLRKFAQRVTISPPNGPIWADFVPGDLTIRNSPHNVAQRRTALQCKKPSLNPGVALN